MKVEVNHHLLVENPEDPCSLGAHEANGWADGKIAGVGAQAED